MRATDQQGKSMAGSHNTGGMTGGRIYWAEGSLAPGTVFTGEPPGMPGSPLPADPNDFPRPELVSFPTPVTGVVTGFAAAGPLTAFTFVVAEAGANAGSWF